MPSPTPPQAVLAAAKALARERFAAGHSYAMALHTHQRHPHVHLVVKVEGLDGRRLHIDKALLRGWRHDFARLLREQDIAANVTPRSVRGQTKRSTRDASYWAKNRRGSRALQREVASIVKDLVAHRILLSRSAPIASTVGASATRPGTSESSTYHTPASPSQLQRTVNVMVSLTIATE
jgi:hypothetical protein